MTQRPMWQWQRSPARIINPITHRRLLLPSATYADDNLALLGFQRNFDNCYKLHLDVAGLDSELRRLLSTLMKLRWLRRARLAGRSSQHLLTQRRTSQLPCRSWTVSISPTIHCATTHSSMSATGEIVGCSFSYGNYCASYITLHTTLTLSTSDKVVPPFLPEVIATRYMQLCQWLKIVLSSIPEFHAVFYIHLHHYFKSNYSFRTRCAVHIICSSS